MVTSSYKIIVWVKLHFKPSGLKYEMIVTPSLSSHLDYVLVIIFKNNYEKQFLRIAFQNCFLMSLKIKFYLIIWNAFKLFFWIFLKIIFISNVLFLIILYVCIIILKKILRRQLKTLKTINFFCKKISYVLFLKINNIKKVFYCQKVFFPNFFCFEK